MPIREMKFKIRVIIEKDEEGGLFAYCPDLQGVAVEGSSIEDIKAHMENAVTGYLQSLLKHDDPIPVGVLQSDTHHSLRSFACDFAKGLFAPKNNQYIQEVMLPDNNKYAM